MVLPPRKRGAGENLYKSNDIFGFLQIKECYWLVGTMVHTDSPSTWWGEGVLRQEDYELKTT